MTVTTTPVSPQGRYQFSVNQGSKKHMAFIICGTFGAVSVIFIFIILFVHLRRRRSRDQRFQNRAHFAPLDDDSNFVPEQPHLNSRPGYHSILSKIIHDHRFFNSAVRVCSKSSLTKPQPTQTLSLGQELPPLPPRTYISTTRRPSCSDDDSSNLPGWLEFPKPPPLHHKRNGRYYSSNRHLLDLNLNASNTFAEPVVERSIPNPRRQTPAEGRKTKGDSSQAPLTQSCKSKCTIPVNSTQIPYSESRHRIDNSIPSPSLYFPTNFGSDARTFPRVGRNSSKYSHARSKSSSMIILPGRSTRTSASSGTLLHATASILSRWRRARDVVNDHDHPVEPSDREPCTLARNIDNHVDSEKGSISVSYPKEAAVALAVGAHRRQSTLL